MTQVPGVGGGSSTSSNQLQKDALRELDMDHFLKLMITELQNQDPLNPMDNNQMLQQIGQIRSVGATDKMTETLDAVLLGQNVSSATSLIGKDVHALNDKGDKVTGRVDKVTIIDGVPRLHVGDQNVKLTNVSEVHAPSDEAAGAT